MKIYITVENKRIIKKNYPSIITKNIAIIDIPSILKNINYDVSVGGISGSFVLSQEIENRLKSIYNNKKYLDLVYILSEQLKPNGLDQGFVSNFKQHIETLGIFFTEYILIDYSSKIDPKIYKSFTTVI